MTDKYAITTPRRLAGKYRILSQLGEGSQGITWLAERKEDAQKVVVKALKFSKEDNLKSYELFERESRVLKSLAIPGVPRFYESIFDSEDTCWLIQECIEDPTLQAILDEKGKLNEKQTLQIMSKIADILIQLQTKYTPPIIHRDIKPSNILCKLGKKDVEVHLIDFGAVANPQKKTGGSTIAGTFGYMAPEQLLGDVRIQSDFYALGATALHLLTGISPVNMKTVVFKILYEGELNKHAPETSPQMRELLAQLLDPDIAKRPVSAEVLKSEIERVSHGFLPSMPKENVGFGRRLLIGLKNIFSLKISDDGWVPDNAMALHIHDNGQIEYTFEANNRTYIGISSSETLQIAPNRLPCICQILYNPNNPNQSRLLEKDEIAKLAVAIATNNIDKRDHWGRTKLMMTTSVKEMRQLLYQGADVNAKDNAGVPVAMYHINAPERLKMILDAGADLNEIQENGEILFFQSKYCQNLESVRLLCQAGYNINAKNKAGDPLLIYEHILKNLELAKILIDSGYDVNATSYNGCPLLTNKQVFSNLELVKLLIDAGYDVNAKDQADNPLLCVGNMSDNLALVKLLIDAGYDVNAKSNNGSPLLSCIDIYPNPELVKLLIDAGYDVNAKNKNGNPLLTDPYIYSNLELVKLLIDAGSDVNAKEKFGDPLLTHPEIYSNLELVKLLIDAGYDVNAKDQAGDPLLSYKDIYSNLELVKLLIDAGYDVNAKDRAGNPILFYRGKIFNNFELVKLLVDAGYDVNAKDQAGNPLLSYKDIYSNLDLVKLLIDAGSDVNAKD